MHILILHFVCPALQDNFCIFIFLIPFTYEFAALAANGGAACAAPQKSSIAKMVEIYEKIRTHFSGAVAAPTQPPRYLLLGPWPRKKSARTKNEKQKFYDTKPNHLPCLSFNL